VQPRGSHGRQDAEQHRDQHRAQVHQQHGHRLHVGWNLVEVVDTAVEQFLASQLRQPIGDFVQVIRDRQSHDRAAQGTDDSEQQPVAQEDLHDAAARGAQRLEHADVAGLLGDDHAKDRQDAEAGDRNDEKEQHIEDALLDANGFQQRSLLLLPGGDAEHRRVEKLLQPLHDHLRVGVVVELDLDGGDAVVH
jgi:hypothetical protein